MAALGCGISGSSVADTSSIGAIMSPVMEQKGYDRDFAVNVTITSSTQGIIIPPSHNAIIYAWVAGGGVSVASLFAAGAVPGVLVGVALLIVSLIISAKRKFPRLLFESLKTVAMVTFLIGSASAFGYFLAYLRIPAHVTEFMLGLTSNR